MVCMIRALLESFSPEHPLGIASVTLVGVNEQTVIKVLITVALFVVVALLSRGARAVLRLTLPGTSHEHGYFWGRQTIRLVAAGLLILGVISIWFDDPTRLATVVGLVSAGVAIALQRVITAFAAYVIVLRGRLFSVGDRITIGGVRGDVVALDFMQTTVMKMGQSIDEQGDAPSMWVHGRQYTGRLVRVTNDKMFDKPIYNFTREFRSFGTSFGCRYHIMMTGAAPSRFCSTSLAATLTVRRRRRSRHSHGFASAIEACGRVSWSQGSTSGSRTTGSSCRSGLSRRPMVFAR
jgi:small-conductance mechanosensitive channel